MPRKILSYSLFGDQRKYYVGALENALLVKYVYPGWILRFYIDDTTDPLAVDSLRAAGCEIVHMPVSDALYGLFWRFLIADDETVERWGIRDADSRLGYRERRAVDDWIDSRLPFHIMRDHINHRKPIMGCSFDGIGGAIKNYCGASMADLIAAWPANGRYADDEKFLREKIYGNIVQHSLIHDSYPDRPNGTRDDSKPFPTPMENERFVGERILTEP